jgi:hypothetical protein
MDTLARSTAGRWAVLAPAAAVILAAVFSCDGAKCVAGATQACQCYAGDTGVQTCSANGTLGDCVCGRPDGGSGGGSGGSGGTGGSGGGLGGGGDATTAAVFTREQAARVCFAFATCLPAEFAWDYGTNLNKCVNLTGPLSFRSPATFTVQSAVARTSPQMLAFYQCVLAAQGNCAAVVACSSPAGPVNV